MQNNPEIIKEVEKYNITDFESAKDFLFIRLMDSEKKLFGRELGIRRTEAWLNELGNPQESFPSIHIAGTSGKGSTAYMVSAILKAGKLDVGTITSPYVYDVRERMLVNNHYLSEEEFTRRTQELVKPITKLEQTKFGRPTYFEALVGMAHKCFNEHKINYAIVETGIGGRLDSTNTIKRNDKLAVITRLGIDHTEILGKTPTEIAWQKAGIIPENGHVIALLPDDTEAIKIIEEEAKLKNSSLYFVNPKSLISNLHQDIDGIKFDYASSDLTIKNLTLPTLGLYQAENACLAIAVSEYLAKRDCLEISSTVIKNGLKKLSIPARAEIIDFNGTPIIIDSAHNPQKLEAFFNLITSLKLPTRPLVIFSAKNTKDWQSSLPKLKQVSAKTYVTGYFNNQPGHLQKYTVNPNEIAKKIYELGGNATAFSSPDIALNNALNDVLPGQPIIITGSMYMLGELYDRLTSLN